MAFFQCDFSNITTEQLAAINAVESLFLEQSMTMTVTSLKPITFNLKATLTDIMIKRLFVDRVPMAAKGFIGLHEDGCLVIQKEKADKPAAKRGARRSKRNSDIQESDKQEVAESDLI